MTDSAERILRFDWEAVIRPPFGTWHPVGGGLEVRVLGEDAPGTLRIRVAGGRHVVVDSRWRFGFPSIGGISTDAVADMFVAGEDLATIAHEYDLAPVEVLRALWFEGRHGGRPGWREWAYAVGAALARGEVSEGPDPDAGRVGS